jgi:hypothetical protein
MNDFYKSPPISAQFSVVRFTVNSQQSTVNIIPVQPELILVR